MINQIEIRNFRCFKQTKLNGLKRFNFIVGESGTGKTALLEALFLASGGNPQIWFRLRRWRGLGEGQMHVGVRETYEALFRDMFYGFDQNSGANIRILDSEIGKRELEIYYKKSNVYRLPLDDTKEPEAFSIDPIQFKWDFGSHIVHSQVIVKDGALQMTGDAKVYPLFLISPRTFSGKDNAAFFSNLSRMKKATPVCKAVAAIFSDVEDLSLELLAGEPQIFVSLKTLPEKIPLGDLSGGLSKYVEIVQSILSNPGGAILIDEIENGFYYNNLADLLRNIIKLCDEQRVQVFATTHSYEFLQVLADVMDSANKGADAFRLLRLERPQGLLQPEIKIIPRVAQRNERPERSVDRAGWESGGGVSRNEWSQSMFCAALFREAARNDFRLVCAY